MARQDNVKIITTALLVVLLLCSFIFLFIYRNEIYQKMQMMSKSNSMDENDRIIEKKPVMSPPFSVQSETETAVSKNQDGMDTETKNRPSLPNQPSLDEMEAGITESNLKSNSSKTPQKLTEEKSQTKEISVLEMKDKDEMMKTPSPVPMMDRPKNKLPMVKGKKEIRQQNVIYHQKPQRNFTKESKRTSDKRRVSKFHEAKKSKTKMEKTKNIVSSSNAKDPNLGARITAMESKFVLQNQKNDKRFDEIEKRIDKLEKSLGSN